ncbi:MAG: acyl-CoA dehydrogenase family protein [Acidimicrobiales bacterium]
MSWPPRAPHIEARSDWSALREAVTAAGRAGHLAYLLPGDGAEPASLVKATMVAEEAAAVSYAFEATVASSLSCGVPVIRHATPAVRERWRPALARGEASAPSASPNPASGPTAPA